MTRELNCRGLTCPEPVLQLKELFAKGIPATVAVIVDNEAARENVSRFLAHQQFEVTVELCGADFRVVGSAGEGGCEIMSSEALVEHQASKRIMVLVGTDRLGHGDDTLGANLLLNFLKTLPEMGPDLWRLVLVNNGVTLSSAGSAAVPILQGIVDNGVTIMVCGTCLEHFKLLAKKEVGETTNMLDIVTSMQLADSVINI